MTLLQTSLRVLCASVLVSLSSPAFAAGTVTTETHGPRSVRIFVPSKPASPLAMIVMLHGCTQEPNGFADGTRMDEVAEENGFVVAYPEQPSSVTPTKCWQWWDTAHQARDAGEPKELADATAAIASAKGVDPQRVYVAGISAGGAMTSILGATYPDRFAAIGVVAGIEYKATTSFGGVLQASSKGGPDPATQADVAVAAMGTNKRPLPAIVFHGTADSVVAKVNGEQVAALWLGVGRRELGPAAIESPASTSVTDGYSFTWSPHVVKAKGGASLVELYMVDDLGHAWPGGKAGGSYSDPKGPKTSRLLWSFFKGRTVAAPLDVPAPVPPTPGSSPGGTTSSSGGSSGNPEGPPDPGGSPATGASESSGCDVATTTFDPRLSGGALLAIAAAFLTRALRRRRRLRAGLRACSCTSPRASRCTHR